MREIYRVTVKDAQPVQDPNGARRRRILDRHEVEVGQWQSIAYWLDERGYIDPAYAIEVRVVEVEASVEVSA